MSHVYVKICKCKIVLGSGSEGACVEVYLCHVTDKSSLTAVTTVTLIFTGTLGSPVINPSFDGFFR
jgi:hypothetical protein